MKKIINGKLYDTETAECLGFYQHFDGNTFHYLREALYRTKKGTYFIYRRHDAENPCIDDFISGMDVPILLFSRKMQCYGLRFASVLKNTLTLLADQQKYLNFKN